MRKTLLSLALLVAPFATAQQSEPLPQETLDTIIQNLKNGRNTAAMVEYIDSINRVPFSDDIYEITYKDKNNEILYVSKDGSYIFQADIISVPDALNIPRERREALAAAKGIASEDDKKESTTKNPDDPPPKAGKQKGDGQFAALPVALAQKEKKGDGSRRLWIVTAPDCDMCKTLEEQLGSISDVTLYRYLYTANDATRQRALAINCHHNPPEALRDHLRGSLDVVALPRSWRVVHRLPRDVQGKLPLAAWQRLFEARPLAPEWVRLEDGTGDRQARFSGQVPWDLVYFAGHFAEFPLVPGVVELDWAITQARTAFTLPPHLIRTEALKFRQFVRPGDTLEPILRAPDAPESTDLLATPEGVIRLSAPRIATRHGHGTGCTLSSAIAALWPQHGLEKATRMAKDYVHGALLHADALQVGHGRGPLHHFWQAVHLPGQLA